ncbi:hypothetical protein QJ043_07050 [Olsenella sp. YH-ols2217]|uniref:Uncharacterized protein n=1 Tax=Kribbibacterium absianum TaxID=3044210 RepID=A0ABT6ZLA8_9ACTN|nr:MULTISPECIES: hypothetical protein [unclassified Olsenella]MDJ1121823.1 hypothetical protein [Olsenella sp. YH-ols2216]MDJ1129831.1 hypothetical protein [Olsenella sp. YH-ols2217]
MNDAPRFDEMQLRDQGFAYQAAFVVAIGVALVVFYVQKLTGIEMSSQLVFTLQFWGPIVVADVLMIRHHAWIGNGGAGDALTKVSVALGGGMFLVGIAGLFTGDDPLNSVCAAIEGACLLGAWLYYRAVEKRLARELGDE